MKNKNILSFMLGILTVVSLIPVVESITEVIQCKLEVAKLKYSKAIMKGNVELMEMQAQSEPQQTFAMGFCATEEPEFEDIY